MIPSYNFSTEENVCLKHTSTPRVVVKQVSNRRHVLLLFCAIFLRPALEENNKTYTDAFLLLLSFFCSKEIVSFFRFDSRKKQQESKCVYRKAHT